MMTEADRLRDFYLFDDDVIGAVSDQAQRQRAMSLENNLAKLPDTKIFHPVDYKANEILDIIPKDYSNVDVINLPVSTSLDPSTKLQIAFLASLQPDKRIIVFSNPGSPGTHNTGKIKFRRLMTVWDGDVTPTIEPQLKYLEQEKIVEANQIGISAGTDQAAAAANHIKAPNAVFIEPPSVKRRSSFQLAIDFASTDFYTKDYVDAAASRPYDEARELAKQEAHGRPGYLLGLARASNLCIAHSITRGNFELHTRGALYWQPEMTATVAWGTKSELADENFMPGIIDRLRIQHGQERVRTIVLEGQRHSISEDPFFLGALVLQGLKN